MGLKSLLKIADFAGYLEYAHPLLNAFTSMSRLGGLTQVLQPRMVWQASGGSCTPPERDVWSYHPGLLVGKLSMPTLWRNGFVHAGNPRHSRKRMVGSVLAASVEQLEPRTFLTGVPVGSLSGTNLPVDSAIYISASGEQQLPSALFAGLGAASDGSPETQGGVTPGNADVAPFTFYSHANSRGFRRWAIVSPCDAMECFGGSAVNGRCSGELDG